jgi:hypothetical protein
MTSTRFWKKIVFLFVIIFILPFSVFAFDFGVIANVYAGYGGVGDENSFEFKANILPRFSFLIGENAELYLSAGITLGEDGGFYFAPELLRTEFSIRFGDSGIRAGRIGYSDPLSFVASGLFDGIQFFYNSSLGSFRVGAWYTGLLYKKSAAIMMTADEQESYNSPLDFSDFLDTYFAPRRLLTSMEWEHSSVGEFVHLNAAVIGQFDLNETESKLHSQYLILKAGIPINNFLMEFGCAFSLSQTVTENKVDTAAAFAADFGFFWLLPSNFNSRLSFTGKIAGGKIEDFCDAFIPLTANYYGYLLQHKMSGLSVFTLNYSSRFSRFFAVSATTSYFVRNDLGTFSGYPLNTEASAEDNEGFFLGPELFARVSWSPVSDVLFNLGGGAFIPALGNAAPEGKVQWRIELTTVISLY